MPDHIGLYILATFVLVVTPGPDVLYITARGIDQGRSAGLASAAGAALAGLVLTLGAALGVSTIMESSAVAFQIFKFLGAAYLTYLGLHRLFKAETQMAASRPPARPLRRLVTQAFVIAVLNPKTALFFVAFLPQFVNPYHGPIRLQLVVLGLILVGIGLCTDSCYALLSGTFGNWLLRRKRLARGQRFLAGGTYVALGVVAAFTRPARAA